MSVYPITNVGKNGNTKHPGHTWNTEEWVARHHKLYLTDEYTESGLRYRLHAKDAHRMEDFLPYVVLCPKCYREMKCVGGPRSLHELGLYECKCSKY